MKQIFEIGTAQYFTYMNLSFFRNSSKSEHWVIRNVKYIYANNEEEAKEKYRNWFFVNYKEITSGYGNWYLASDGVNIMMNEKWIDITSTKIIAVNNKFFNASLKKLQKNMQAENFKEWWFDTENHNIG